MENKNLEEMTAKELCRLFSELEDLRQDCKDVFTMVVDGIEYNANNQRTETRYMINGEPVDAMRFFYLQDLAKIELVCRYGLSIQARPRHRRKPKRTELDGIITIPTSLLDETETYDEETILGKDDNNAYL